jgi:uncharacterized protein with HEPN domain
MSETEKYTLEIILEHLNVCEKRFSEIKTPQDFVNTEYGNTLLDAIVARLQAVGENLKRFLKHSTTLQKKYPDIEWEKIIQFRDFISHHYEKLDYEIIFDICKTDVPELIGVITTELNA